VTRRPERTLQQLDPLGSGVAWDLALVLAVVSWIAFLAAGLPAVTSGESTTWGIAVILVFTATVMLHLWCAHPHHAPYTRTRYAVFVALLTASCVLELLAAHQPSTSETIATGPIVLTIMLASASPFRPSVDQYTIGAAGVIGWAIALGIVGPGAGYPWGHLYFVLASVAPVLVVVGGQASFTGIAGRIMVAWHANASRGSSHVTPELLSRVAELTAEDVSARLAREAQPLLLEVVTSGRLTETNIEDARARATALRTWLLDATSRNWVTATGLRLSDDRGLVELADPAVRTTVVALCTALADAGASNLSLALATTGENTQVVATLSGVLPGRATRLPAVIEPYLRLLHAVSRDVRAEALPGAVSIKFHYGENH
jgi:hypothetical protein